MGPPIDSIVGTREANGTHQGAQAEPAGSDRELGLGTRIDHAEVAGDYRDRPDRAERQLDATGGAGGQGQVTCCPWIGIEKWRCSEIESLGGAHADCGSQMPGTANRLQILDPTGERFGSLDVPAGTYTLYSILNASGGTLIINRQTGQNGQQYDAARDLGRVPLVRRPLDAAVETFAIRATETAGGGGMLHLMWDRAEYVARFTVPSRAP